MFADHISRRVWPTGDWLLEGVSLLALLLFAQLAQAARGASNYSSQGLQRFVAEAAASVQPATLAGYRARLETDVAVLLPDPEGLQHATQLEQIESELSWRPGRLEQHVIGYRARSGPSISALSLMRRPWVLPTLYENRLRLLLGSNVLEGASDALAAVHPLGADRDEVYSFRGGDTVTVMHPINRRVTVVRVYVTPRTDLSQKTLVFRGYLDIDAERKQVVHMHGALLTPSHASLLGRARAIAIQRAVFIDILEGEFAGRYWLPTYERVDIQGRSSLSEGFRPAFRAVTRFHDIQLDTSVATLAALPDTAPTSALTFAPSDSLRAFTRWHEEIGASAAVAAANDFDDVVEQTGTARGEPRLEWRAEQLWHVFRYDKVEGLYTGAAGRLRFADSAVSLSAHAGWSEADRAVRGAGSLSWRHSGGGWHAELLGQRELENTSDFIPPLEGPATVGALLASIDDYDYVDRALGEIALTRVSGARRTRLLRVAVGGGRDAAVHTNVLRGLFLFDSTFRPNRPVTEGSYVRTTVRLSGNPSVSGDYLEPGIGYDLSFTRGDGQLHWRRVEGVLAARHTVGPLTYYGRFDAAAVFGGSPYQQLIEFGENEGMPGYSYKEFGGDRAALGRLAVSYTLPVLTAPMHLHRWLTIPGPTPAITVGFQGGWADAVAPETRLALQSAGYKPGPNGIPVLRTGPTGRVRSSVAVAFDLFGGEIGLGLAHPLDRGGWVFILGSQAW